MRTLTQRTLCTLCILVLTVTFITLNHHPTHSLLLVPDLHAETPSIAPRSNSLYLPHLIGTGSTFTPTPTPTEVIPPTPTPTPTPTVPTYGPEICENFTVSDDTYVDPNAPGTHGNERRLTVSSSARAFLFADLLSIPTGSLITQASLVIHVAGVWGPPSSIALHQVLHPWRENWISHRAYPPYAPTPETTLTYTETGAYSLDVQPLVQGWISAHWPNVGVALAWNGDSHWGNWQIYSSEAPAQYRPYFRVCYREPLAKGEIHTPPERAPFQFVGYGSGIATSIAVWGTTLLVGGPGELRIYDITSPTRPHPLARVELGGPLVTDIHVQGGIAYLIQEKKVVLLDISQIPPQVLGQYTLGSLARQITVTDEGRYAFVNSLAGVVKINVTDPMRPSPTDIYPTSFVVGGMATQGEYLYLWGNQGRADTRFEVLVNEQGALRPVATLLISGVNTISAHDGDGGMVVTDNMAYFGAQPIVVDISHPEQPVVRHRDGWIGPVVDVTHGQEYLFTVSLDGYIKAIDIHTPHSPVERYAFALIRDMEHHFGSATYRITRQSRYIYAAMGEHGVIILRK